MRTKQEIVSNWLPRYTGLPLEAFKSHVLLTNFDNYLDIFCQQTGATIPVRDKAMKVAVAEDMVMINFGMGSPTAATVMDLLTAISPKAVLFLGKCGGLKRKNELGDLILPIAAIRGEGTSNDCARASDWTKRNSKWELRARLSFKYLKMNISIN